MLFRNPTANGAVAGAPRPFDMNSLLGLFGTLGGGGAPEGEFLNLRLSLMSFY